jgi:hypothetical protein
MVKNGVPIGYAESLALFERTEFGFNLFYTFRDGESAWIYARLLHLFRQYLGVTVIAIDPYQIGFHNEEAIESGAFWFYRKLGFRPVKPELAKMVAREEQKISRNKTYRTPKTVLRKLAAGHLLYESPSTSHPGDWDYFHMRNIGLAVQRRLAEQFDGDEQKIRRSSAQAVAEVLGLDETDEEERRIVDNMIGNVFNDVFTRLAMALALIPDLSLWSDEEKMALNLIVQAKASGDESRYVRLLQSHAKLRQAIIRIGSQDAG